MSDLENDSLPTHSKAHSDALPVQSSATVEQTPPVKPAVKTPVKPECVK